LAVVDMHRDLFQPHNDTQTSMVLLRKWGVGESAQTVGDYPIFMAIADTVGHNKRGKTIYKRSPDGSLILEDKFDPKAEDNSLRTDSGGIRPLPTAGRG